MIKVTHPLTTALTTTIKTDLVAIDTLVDPILIPLNKTQKKGLVGVGAARDAEVRAIESEIMEVYPSTIPDSFTLTDFQALDVEQTNCDALEAICTNLASTFKEHGAIIRNNRMLMSIAVLDNARLGAKNDSLLASSVKVITDTYLTHGPKTGITTFNIANGGVMAIAGLRNRKPIINNGTTVLTVLENSSSAALTLTINPGDSKLMPKGWVNAKVTNLSATNEGSFQVHI